MGLRKSLKKLIKNIGSKSFSPNEIGINFFADVKRLVPDHKMTTIFDVGANVGQSAIEMIKESPDSKIYCFEPIAKTYNQLEKSTKELSSVNCYKTALGSSKNISLMTADGVSSKNHLVEADTDIKKTEEVNVTTLDDFCQVHDITHINFLKIDTEGNDLEVLKGADQMLKKHHIDFVEVEAGMGPLNDYHVPLERFKTHLEDLGYYLFGIYEQTSEWRLKQKHLRRANMVFMVNTNPE